MTPVWRRGLAALSVFLLTLTALPVSAAPGGAEVRISAEEMDTPQETLRLACFQRDQEGVFQQVEELEFTTPVNRVTEDVMFYLTPQVQQTALTVDYLTDLDGDGVYELLQGGENPVNDVLTPSGTLAAASGGLSTALTERTYVLTAKTLLSRAAAALEDRAASGSASFLPGVAGAGQAPESVLYMITVSYPAGEGERTELCYYLRLFPELPAPSAGDYLDVPEDAWYYGAVDYAVSHGLLSGPSRSRFSPDAPLTRAMLAQTLYQLAGEPGSGLSRYEDVPDGVWCYAAVSWVSEKGLMSGSAGRFEPDRAPTRQELALTLYRFAQEQGVNVRGREPLDGYADGGQVAPWARNGVMWAVSAGLLAGRESGGALWLAPAEPVTRGEFAAVLQTLCETVLP